MWKSLQGKLVTIFVLLTVSVMILVGTFLVSSITNYYHQDFLEKMEAVFSLSDFKTPSDSLERLVSKVESFAGRLGIDSYRTYYILDSKGELRYCSDESRAGSLEKSPNLIAALSGEVGNSTRDYGSREYMDYAQPVYISNGIETEQYVIYVRDEKNTINEMLGELYSIIFRAILFGLIISVVLGFLLANTITTPIARLTRRAQNIAEGSFDEVIPVKSTDEIGRLTGTFNEMAAQLKENLGELETEKNRMEIILHHMTDGVAAFDTAGKIMVLNRVGRKLLGLRGKPENYPEFNEIFSMVEPKVTLSEMLYMRERGAVERTYEMNHLHVHAWLTTFRGERAGIGGILAVLQDVTKQEALENSRREFVSNVSHELKTPLTTIESYVETILDSEPDPDTQKRFLGVVLQEAERMSRLVKDLLALSNLDSHKNKLHKEPLSLKELITEVVEQLSLSAQKSGHKLVYTATTKMPEILGDRDRLGQVLKNVVSNALKYTPEGGSVMVYSGALNREVYIKVIDTGIGIPQEDLPRIFERFYRVDKARSRDMGGTGLGLAIAKEIMEAHGGSINIRSEVGVGTEVMLKLPVEV